MKKSDQYHYLTTRYLTENDARVLGSLVNLLESKLQHHWRVVTDHPNSVAVVDTNNVEGMAFFKQHADNSNRFIVLSNQPPPEARAVLSKPIRARNLLELLNHPDGFFNLSERKSAQTKPNQTIVNREVFRMLKWPSRLVITSNPGIQRVAAVLSRQELSIDDLAKRVGLVEGQVKVLLDVLILNDCAQRVAGQETIEKAETISKRVVTARGGGFFSSLKKHLGLS